MTPLTTLAHNLSLELKEAEVIHESTTAPSSQYSITALGELVPSLYLNQVPGINRLGQPMSSKCNQLRFGSRISSIYLIPTNIPQRSSTPTTIIRKEVPSYTYTMGARQSCPDKDPRRQPDEEDRPPPYFQIVDETSSFLQQGTAESTKAQPRSSVPTNKATTPVVSQPVKRKPRNRRPFEYELQHDNEISELKLEHTRALHDLRMELSGVKNELFSTTTDLRVERIHTTGLKDRLSNSEKWHSKTRDDLFNAREDLFQARGDLFQAREDLFQAREDLSKTRKELSKARNDPQVSWATTDNRVEKRKVKNREDRLSEADKGLSKAQEDFSKVMEELFDLAARQFENKLEDTDP